MAIVTIKSDVTKILLVIIAIVFFIGDLIFVVFMPEKMTGLY